jgi:hypothetical protein
MAFASAARATADTSAGQVRVFTIHTMSAAVATTFALLVWTLLPREAGAQTASASASLSGRVVSIAAGTIAEATVTLTRLDSLVPSGRGESNRSSGSSQSVTTDRQGAFTIRGLAAGRYRLSASKTGYTNRQLQPSADRFDTGREVTLRDSGRVTRAELTLYRESTISGRVAEPDGIPAPDAQVFAAVRRGSSYVLLRDTRTIAEWDGRYRITGLPPGEYLIVVMPGAATDPGRMRVNAERRAPESSSATRPFFEPTLYPGVTSVTSAEAITVVEGVPVAGIDTWLVPGERHSISGRIVWPEDTIVENVVIEYANLTAQRSGLWTVPEPGDVFHITSVPRGTVVLLARADSSRGPLAGVVTTAVNVDEIDDLELRLAAPGTVEGRVVYGTNVPGATRASQITLKQRLLPVSPLYPTPESVVGADGRFRITGALGVYDLEVPGLRIVRVTQHGREIPKARIQITAGESLTDLEVTVAR